MKPTLARDDTTRARGIHDGIRPLLGEEQRSEGSTVARILVIDDEGLLRSLLRMALEEAGHDVAEAPDGNAGIAMLRDTSVDLIVTDIVMPGKEGLDTIPEIRRDYPEVKVIAISGGGRLPGNLYLRIAELLGADRALCKPFAMHELVQTVADLLSARAARPPPPGKTPAPTGKAIVK